MKAPPKRQLDREAAALKELGRTDVSRRLSRQINFGFIGLLVLFVVGELLSPLWDENKRVPLVVQFWQETGRSVRAVEVDPEQSPFENILSVNRSLRTVLEKWENYPEEEAWLAPWMRPLTQLLFSDSFGVGNEQVYMGRDGWLFFRDDVDALLERPLSEESIQARVRTVIDFRDQLAERNIQLFLVPTPVKPSLYSDFLSPRLLPSDTIRSRSEEDILNRLKTAGVEVLDPMDFLNEHFSTDGRPGYLQTDTHWTPEAMESVAGNLAEKILKNDWVSEGRRDWPRQRIPHAGVGDTLSLLGLPKWVEEDRKEEVRLWTLHQPERMPEPIERDSPILLLGDSFTNIFSVGEMGWGERGGFAEHLAWHLRQPVDRLSRNDAGASSTRQLLSREMARGFDRLEGKRVVVWQFAAREWVWGQWEPYSLALGDRDFENLLSLEENETIQVRAIVREASPVPRPATVAYPDHVRSLHLIEIQSLDGEQLPVDEAVVYIRSMTNNRWTPAASLRSGQEVVIKLQSWTSVEGDYGSLNRSELDDLELQLAIPLWGVLLD